MRPRHFFSDGCNKQNMDLYVCMYVHMYVRTVRIIIVTIVIASVVIIVSGLTSLTVSRHEDGFCRGKSYHIK